MIDDNAHAARLQERHERFAHADTPTASAEFRTLAALAGLLKHFTGNDDGICDELVDAARDCAGDDASELIREWDYSDTPQAALTYLATRFAPSQPVNKGNVK